jgi:hypothetical protein
MMEKPPSVINSARIIAYAVLDESVCYRGHSSLFVDGKEVGAVPCLAIGQDLNDTEIFLFHCDRDWAVLGVVGYASINEAKDHANRLYAGVSNRWIETHVTKQEASEYLQSLEDDARCAFCGKGPRDAVYLIEKGGKRICDSCIKDFHRLLHDD